jgi:hypothetical protein
MIKKLACKQNVTQGTTCEMCSIMTVSISDEIKGGVDGVPCKVGRTNTQFWWGNRKERHHLAGLGTDTRCLKSNETGAIKFLLTTELQITTLHPSK